MTVKSQDDLNQPETHSTEVLLSTIEELERTKKQLEIAKKRIELYCGTELWKRYVGLCKRDIKANRGANK